MSLSNYDRAEFANAALNAMRNEQSAAAILEAYCSAKEGRSALYDELVDVASDAVSDTLHALAQDQFGDELESRVIDTDEMDLTEFYKMISIMAPHVNSAEFNAEDFERRAFSHFYEEQEESLES